MEMERKLLTQTQDNKEIARRRPPRFDLIAGNVSLDFVNTLDDRHIKPKELLETYADLARFGEDTGLLEPSHVDRLYERSYADPESAQQALLWARELREAIHDVFWAIMNKRAAPPLARLLCATASMVSWCSFCVGAAATAASPPWMAASAPPTVP